MGDGFLQQVRSELPLPPLAFSLPPNKSPGLVIVDEVNGFCSFGTLAPELPDPQISLMIEETNKLAREFSIRNSPMLVLLDSHDADKPEPPYEPHCIRGSGEDELVSDLQWLKQDNNAFLLQKDCTDGYIGGLQPDGTNAVRDWVHKNNVQLMVVVGICTDVCVLDFVLSVLSARNHGILQPLEEVIVYSKACATSDLPKEVADQTDGAMAHPQALMHHIGLYMAKLRGAHVVDNISFSDCDAHA